MDEIYIVDRVEEKNIILETQDGAIINVNKMLIEPEIKTGDCLRRIGENYIIDDRETNNRKERISNLMKGMWAD